MSKAVVQNASSLSFEVMMEHCKIFRVYDRFHDGLYKSQGSSPRFVYSNEECFGDNDFEKLSNFLHWCIVHQVPINEIVHIVE
jgi:hypothetical protein